MGSNLSCVPQNNSLRSSSKSFIRRNSSRLFRKKNPEEGQVKSTSIINIMSSISPMKEMSPQDLQRIGKIKWDPPYDPTGGWKKSSINVKNYGRMIHSSKVQFRFLHCQDVHDCFLDLFQTHLHFLSNTTTGLTYQGTLPLSDLTICKLQSKDMNDPDRFAFQMDGIGLNPIIVYCSCQEEVDHWFSLLKEHVEASGGTVNAPEARTYARIRSKRDATRGKEELRNSVKYEPIYEWEGSQRESLGPITYVTKVRLQHLPCQDQYDRLLVMYPSTLIILSEESNRFFYKGKLPLNSINITTPCQDVKPNTFMIEGKLINPIVVSCLDKNDFNDWIGHFIASQIPVQIPPPPIYDIIYTPTKTKAPEFDRVSYRGSQRLRQSQNGRGSYELPLQNQADNPLSPGYSEPLCFISSRPTSTETGMSARLSSRSNSVSSQARPVLERRPPSSQRSSTVSADVPLSPVYSAPYSSVYCSAPHQQPVKVPLVKSNSWSTPQTSMKYHLSVQNRNSDMCPSRKPLSPLYDDPDTPGRYMPEDNYVKPAMPRQCWGEQGDKPGTRLLPSSFRLCAPPLGRRGKSSSFPEQEVESPSRRKDAMSHSAAAALGHSSFAQAIYQPQRHQMSADYSQEEMAYLEPTEPDDQETDYDNIWDVDNYNGMIQPPLSPASDFDILEATGHDWKGC